ncbi:MAG TPA: acyl-CoA thioesterase [Chitinophagaceae bacterium]|nr:acyl-CoA thioesterase [Chitinophagaceae bacterium]
MKELSKILESRMKIRFHDCDPFNHLNNSRYIDYILTARGDQLLDYYNLDIYQVARTRGLGWVSAQTQICYLQPALLMEEVCIQTCLIGYSPRSLLLEAFMWDGNKTRLKTVMWARLVHYNLQTATSHTHAEEFRQLFEQVSLPLLPAIPFEERIKSLREEIARGGLPVPGGRGR